MESKNLPEHITNQLDMSIYTNIAKHSVEVWRLFSIVSRSMSEVFNMQSRRIFFPGKLVPHIFKDIGKSCICGVIPKMYVEYEERPWYLNRKKYMLLQPDIRIKIDQPKPLIRGVELRRRDQKN